MAAAVLIGATHANDQPQAAPAAPDLNAAVTTVSTTVVALDDAEPQPTGVRFAEIDGAELVLPAADVVAHGFHEAGGNGPETITPIGTLESGEGANGFDASGAVADADGPDYLVLPTRQRGTTPTSAVDIVVEPGEDVLAPVDGIVTTVADYTLYGKHTDTLVRIRPDAAPHLEVKILHIGGVTVAEGDSVIAGESVIADTARRFPVSNQIDTFVGRALPHAHLEVIASASDA